MSLAGFTVATFPDIEILSLEALILSYSPPLLSLIMNSPLPEVTFSEKERMKLELGEALVAPSNGESDDSVGIIPSTTISLVELREVPVPGDGNVRRAAFPGHP